jgi:SOS-response transcriptional repressor LexA
MSIRLDNNPYSLHSTAESKQQITLVEGLNYGWAKVFGDSMVAANIDENDYVLFYESADADHRSIVVASLLEPNETDIKLIVKRYNKIDHLLCSETIPPNLYDPLELGRETKILGTVVAIAKLIHETPL